MQWHADSGRRGLLAGLGFGAGVAWQVHQAEAWPLAWAAAGLVAGLVAALVGVVLLRARRAPGAAPVAQLASARARRVPEPVALAAWGLVAVLVGASLASIRAQWRLDERLPPALEGRDIRVRGIVTSLPVDGAAGLRFRFDVEQFDADELDPIQAAALPRRLALGWYRPALDDPDALQRHGQLRAGQRWRLTVRLKQPHAAQNPHGYDYELALFEAGVRATGSVRDRPGQEPRLLDAAAGAPVQRARQAIRDGIRARVADPSAAGILAALAVGDQAAIDRADWDLFRHTGVAHLMSISGLHVTLFAWLAALAVGALWQRSARAMSLCATPLAARWGGLGLAAGYALLAGWGVPAQRTVLMLAVVTLLRSGAWQWPWPHRLLAAAVAVLLLDPWALLQPGFWLSFVAVALLMGSEPAAGLAPARLSSAGDPIWRRALAAAAAALRGHLRTQAIATAGLAPLSLLCFQQVSLVGMAANLIAIPFVTLLLAPLALAGIVLPPLWPLAATLAGGMTAVLGLFAQWPAGVWTAAAPPAWAMAAALLGAALAVAPLPVRLRLLALPLMLPLLWPPVPRPAPGAMEVVAVDVGQGTAVLVRTRSHLLLYDAGPQYSLEADAGQRVLVPLLRARGERQVDLLMLSHRDLDHVGGAQAVLAALPVKAVLSSLEAGHPLRRARGAASAGASVASPSTEPESSQSDHRPPHRPCADGELWEWDGVRFEVLHPVAGATDPPPPKANAVSCVLQVTDAAGHSLLLTGDIEAAQEAALVQRHGARLSAQVLLVPHHGSRTSSTSEFLEAVRPRVAIVQAGYRSRFGHPHPQVVQRYRERGIALVRSDHCGAWSWRTDSVPALAEPGGAALLAEGGPACTRANRARYWHWQPAGPELAGAAPPELDNR